jgi:tyrosine-specific transport protein
VLYIFWLATILGVISPEQFETFDQGAHTDIGSMITLITELSHSKWAAMGVDLFSDIALMTSFLGVTLGLFDFMADACKRPYTTTGRVQTALITFIPPLLFALFYPSGFILALGYAAIFVAIMQIIMPALMVMKKRKRKDLPSHYRAPGGYPALTLTLLLGIGLIALQCGINFHVI